MSHGVSAGIRTRSLSELSARELKPLLDEESAFWGRELLWDYTDVSGAVASGVERRALTGRVAEESSRLLAYCYSMLDSGRAIVGALFASAAVRGQGLEERLLEEVLAEAQGDPGNTRVECQTLFSTTRGADACFSRAGFQGRRRHYLVRDLTEPIPAAAEHVRLRPLRREELSSAAQIVFHSHEGSLDAALNLTYATLAHCRAFVETLVLRAGCGRFEPESSLVAEGRQGPVGVLLASRLSRSNGHICQVSVLPGEQGRGVGSALVCTALATLSRAGLRTASLSVTVENRRAYELYERLGFRVLKEFAAHAWARPPGRIELPPSARDSSPR